MRINGIDIFNRAAAPLGLRLVKANKMYKMPPELDEEAARIITTVQPFTMLSPPRLFAFITAVRYAIRNSIPGAIVECGVYKGGAIGAAALTLKALGAERPIYLFDTFAGMAAPTAEDGERAAQRFEELSNGWARAGIEEVRNNLISVGLDPDEFHFVEGMVEDTIPQHAPDEIAILRLDTDFYSSTKHELEHLFPRVPQGGVLLIDDYSDWEGSRKAVDEYIEANGLKILLAQVHGSTVSVKP